MTLESSTEYYRKRGEKEEEGFDQMEREDDTSEENGAEDPDFANKKDVSPEELETGSGEIGPPIQKFSSGDYSTTTGIVQPESMPNIFPSSSNKIVETLNSLLERFSTPKNYQFDMVQYSQVLMSDARFPLNSSWYTDYSVLTCPGTKFTDRFLIHGEFFTDNP